MEENMKNETDAALVEGCIRILGAKQAISR